MLVPRPVDFSPILNASQVSQTQKLDEFDPSIAERTLLRTPSDDSSQTASFSDGFEELQIWFEQQDSRQSY
jgi:hypothetical protein